MFIWSFADPSTLLKKVIKALKDPGDELFISSATLVRLSLYVRTAIVVSLSDDHAMATSVKLLFPALWVLGRWQTTVDLETTCIDHHDMVSLQNLPGRITVKAGKPPDAYWSFDRTD